MDTTPVATTPTTARKDPAPTPSKGRTPTTAAPTTPSPAVTGPPVAPTASVTPATPPSTTPTLKHTRLTHATVGTAIEISATIAGGGYRTTLYYRPNADGAPYRSKIMVDHGDTYTATITLDDSFKPGLAYHISAAPEREGLPPLQAGNGFSPIKVKVE